MQKLRHVLGWIVTIVAAALFIAVKTGAEFAKELAEELIPAALTDSWIGTVVMVVVLGACVAFWVYALLSSNVREAWRQARAERAERRRKLENFEL